eukprot:2951783-Prymnesium_polylepis.2
MARTNQGPGSNSGTERSARMTKPRVPLRLHRPFGQDVSNAQVECTTKLVLPESKNLSRVWTGKMCACITSYKSTSKNLQVSPDAGVQ